MIYFINLFILQIKFLSKIWERKLFLIYKQDQSIPTVFFLFFQEERSFFVPLILYSCHRLKARSTNKYTEDLEYRSGFNCFKPFLISILQLTDIHDNVDSSIWEGIKASNWHFIINKGPLLY